MSCATGAREPDGSRRIWETDKLCAPVVVCWQRDWSRLSPTASCIASGCLPPACLTAAKALGTGAVNTLMNVGCYVSQGSVLIPPALGSYGNASRDLFRGPGITNVDLSITKIFRFRERISAQFRAEAFNVFNHPNFANPQGGPNGYANNDPSAGFGMGCGCITPDVAGSNPVLGSGGPRAIQLGLKILF